MAKSKVAKMKKVGFPVKCVVHLMSESSDHYYVKIREAWPKDEAKQVALLRKYHGGSDLDAEGGPGIGGTWVHVMNVTEV